VQKNMNMKFVVVVDENERRKNQCHLENVHVSLAHLSDIRRKL
jgi:hypothetical protein